MAAKPRVHEIASEMGIDSKVALAVLKDLGEFVKGPSSSIQPPVARKLRTELERRGLTRPELIDLGDERLRGAILAGRLPASFPEFAALLGKHSPGPTLGRSLLRAATASENLFYSPSGAAETIHRHEHTAQTLRPEDIPAPLGLAVICGTPDRRYPPQWLLWWRATETRLEIARAEFRMYEVPSDLGVPRLRFEPVQYAVIRTRGTEVYVAGSPGTLLAGMVHAIPTAPVREAAGKRGAPRATPDPQENTGTQIIYLRRASTGNHIESVADTVHRLSQWTVRGHWRNQFYPSEKDHHRIWIDEHHAGTADAPLVTRRKVFVIRPRGGY